MTEPAAVPNMTWVHSLLGWACAAVVVGWFAHTVWVRFWEWLGL